MKTLNEMSMFERVAWYRFLKTYTPEGLELYSAPKVIELGDSLSKHKNYIIGEYYFNNEDRKEFVDTASGKLSGFAQQLGLSGLVLTFFGMPTRLESNGRGLYYFSEFNLKRLLKNWVGWPEKNDPLYKKILFGSMIVPAIKIIFNVFSVVAKTAVNILKLVTEFLPGLAADLLTVQINKLNARIEKSKKENKAVAIGDIALLALCYVGFALCKSLQIVGTIITSPGKSAKNAYYFAKNKVGGKAGTVLGVALAALSIAASAAVYTIVFPLGIKMAIAKSPTIAAGLGSAVKWLSSTPIISKIYTGISTAGKAVITPILNYFGINLAPVALEVASTVAASTALAVTVDNVNQAVANRYALETKEKNIFTPLLNKFKEIGKSFKGIRENARNLGEQNREIIQDAAKEVSKFKQVSAPRPNPHGGYNPAHQVDDQSTYKVNTCCIL